MALLLVELGQLGLGGLALADVPDGRGDEGALRGLQRAEADLHGELAAVLAQPVQVQVRAHGANAAVVDVAVPVGGVVPVETLRDQHLHLTAEEFLSSVAEQGLRLGVDQLDGAAVVHDDDGVRCGLQQGTETCFRRLTFADVAHGGGDEESVGRLQRADADLDRELGPVPAQSVQFEVRAHGADLLVVGVAQAVARMLGAETLRHQDLDGAPEQFSAGIAEQGFRLGVDQTDHPGVVHDHHRVGGRLQQCAEGLLGHGDRVRSGGCLVPARVHGTFQHQPAAAQVACRQTFVCDTSLPERARTGRRRLRRRNLSARCPDRWKLGGTAPVAVTRFGG